MNIKASDANKLLCDNTVKTHHVSRSDYSMKTWLSIQDLVSEAFIFMGDVHMRLI